MSTACGGSGERCLGRGIRNFLGQLHALVGIWVKVGTPTAQNSRFEIWYYVACKFYLKRGKKNSKQKERTEAFTGHACLSSSPPATPPGTAPPRHHTPASQPWGPCVDAEPVSSLHTQPRLCPGTHSNHSPLTSPRGTRAWDWQCGGTYLWSWAWPPFSLLAFSPSWGAHPGFTSPWAHRKQLVRTEWPWKKQILVPLGSFLAGSPHAFPGSSGSPRPRTPLRSPPHPPNTQEPKDQGGQQRAGPMAYRPMEQHPMGAPTCPRWQARQGPICLRQSTRPQGPPRGLSS